MSECRDCRAPILWAVVTSSGKKMPLDAEPVESGNITVESRDERGVPQVRYVTVADRAQGRTGRYVSHFSTCPAAKKFRRNR